MLIGYFVDSLNDHILL